MMLYQIQQLLFSPPGSSRVESAALSVLPVEELVLQIARILFSSSCTRTTASLFTLPNPPRSAKSFPSKFIWPTLQIKSLLICAACSDLTAALWRRAVDFERESFFISPPPWFVTAAITDVRTFLESSSRPAAGPSFFRKSLGISSRSNRLSAGAFRGVFFC